VALDREQAEMPLAQPPSPPSSPPGEPPAEMHKNRFPVVWKGAVNLKSQSVRVRLHELDGSHAALSGNTLSENMPSVVTVTQRMRLEEEQIQKFAQELVSLRQRGGVHRTFIGHADDESEGILEHASGGAGAGSVSRLTFKTHLVKYLNDRSVAGVVQLDNNNSAWDRLYIFPPGEFATKCISTQVEDLDMSKHESYVFVVLLPKA